MTKHDSKFTYGFEPKSLRVKNLMILVVGNELKKLRTTNVTIGQLIKVKNKIANLRFVNGEYRKRTFDIDSYLKKVVIGTPELKKYKTNDIKDAFNHFTEDTDEFNFVGILVTLILSKYIDIRVKYNHFNELLKWKKLYDKLNIILTNVTESEKNIHIVTIPEPFAYNWPPTLKKRNERSGGGYEIYVL